MLIGGRRRVASHEKKRTKAIFSMKAFFPNNETALEGLEAEGLQGVAVVEDTGRL